MATRFDKTKSSNHSIDGGYEGENVTHNYTIPSCGLEDVDKAVFNLFDKQIPFFYESHGEKKRVPVIFATGERFAILRRKRPITDRSGALILPLISINRNAIENVPQKGMSNNQMFPNVITKRISRKDMEHRQLNNIEGLENVKFETKSKEKTLSLHPNLDNNIIETIEMPPIKYFGVTYEITLWSSFTSQMNNLLEAIMSSYTHNPGQNIKIESDKGYWFNSYIDSSFSPDTTYADFTDSERFIKTNITLYTTGYLILPNLKNGKVGLRSYFSSPEISFEVNSNYVETESIQIGIQDSDPDSRLLDDLATHDDLIPTSGIGLNSKENIVNLKKYDKTSGRSLNSDAIGKSYDRVGEFNSEYTRNKKTAIRKADGSIVEISVKQGGKGETIYDQKMADILFNISTSK
jgi:hypothetical protein